MHNFLFCEFILGVLLLDVVAKRSKCQLGNSVCLCILILPSITLVDSRERTIYRLHIIKSSLSWINGWDKGKSRDWGKDVGGRGGGTTV